MRGKPSRVTAVWDACAGAGNAGWSWHAYWDGPGGVDHEESGGFDGRDSLASETAARRARAAAGHPGTRIPAVVYRP